MGIDFRWIKFTNFADDLIKGNIYLNPLEYYRGIEKVISGKLDENENRNTAINDYLEGSVASINPKDLGKFGLDWDDELKDALVGNVHLLSEDLKYLKVFCLYSFVFDNENKIAIKPSQKINLFGNKYAVIINDTGAFIRRIINCLKNSKGYDKIVAFKGEFVRYYENDEKTKLLSVFNKTNDFEWEHEFRFIFPEKAQNLDPIVLQIGDISDITTVITVEDFLNSPETIFPDYTFLSEKSFDEIIFQNNTKR